MNPPSHPNNPLRPLPIPPLGAHPLPRYTPSEGDTMTVASPQPPFVGRKILAILLISILIPLPALMAMGMTPTTRPAKPINQTPARIFKFRIVETEYADPLAHQPVILVKTVGPGAATRPIAETKTDDRGDASFQIPTNQAEKYSLRLGAGGQIIDAFLIKPHILPITPQVLQPRRYGWPVALPPLSVQGRLWVEHLPHHHRTPLEKSDGLLVISSREKNPPPDLHARIHDGRFKIYGLVPDAWYEVTLDPADPLAAKYQINQTGRLHYYGRTTGSESHMLVLTERALPSDFAASRPFSGPPRHTAMAHASFKIQIHVVNEDDQPLSFKQVTVTLKNPTSGAAMYVARTNTQGMAMVVVPNKGEARIVCLQPIKPPARVMHRQPDHHRRRYQPILGIGRFNISKDTDVTLKCPDRRDLHGIIQNGQPGDRILFIDPKTRIRTGEAVLNPDGSYVITLILGRHDIYLARGSHSRSLGSITLSNDSPDDQQQDFTIKPDAFTP